MSLLLAVLFLLTFSSPVLAVDFETIRNNMRQMTSVAWGDYSESLKGQRVDWVGWVSDVMEDGDVTFRFAGKGMERIKSYRILIDMDRPGQISVQDVYIGGFSKDFAAQFRKGQRVRFSGKIKSVEYVLGSCAVTIENGDVRPLE